MTEDRVLRQGTGLKGCVHNKLSQTVERHPGCVFLQHLRYLLLFSSSCELQAGRGEHDWQVFNDVVHRKLVHKLVSTNCKQVHDDDSRDRLQSGVSPIFIRYYVVVTDINCACSKLFIAVVFFVVVFPS